MLQALRAEEMAEAEEEAAAAEEQAVRRPLEAIEVGDGGEK